MRKLVSLSLVVAALATQSVSDPPAPGSEFSFIRIQFNQRLTARFQREAPWHHDYPFSENFFLGMLQSVTTVRTDRKSFQIVKLDDPELLKYPWSYISEPGYMDLTDKELVNLREYLNRGGFILCDDFRGRDMENLRNQMRRVFPDREFVALDLSHPVFNSFYEIDSLDIQPPYGFDPPRFWGLMDPQGNIQVLANHNNDFGEFWEWVDRGEMPFKPAAESVKFGINYLMYAFTH